MVLEIKDPQIKSLRPTEEIVWVGTGEGGEVKGLGGEANISSGGKRCWSKVEDEQGLRLLRKSGKVNSN